MLDENALSAGEQRVAWLRIAAILLIVAAERLPHPHPDRATFDVAAALAFAYAIAVLAYAFIFSPTRRVSLAITAVDVLGITVLAYLSGGAYSDARLAYLLIPIAVAFRFGWQLTLFATGVVVLAYVLQAVTHPALKLKHSVEFVIVQTGYFLWIGAAAALFSALIATRTEQLTRLARGRRQLVAEVVGAEERERRQLAERLHDRAIQSLLAARQDVEDAAKSTPDPNLYRAEAALTEAVADLRGTISELHPQVIRHGGLEPALRAAAESASRRGGFDVDLYVDYRDPHPDEVILLGAAREFLTNAARHARASTVEVSLVNEPDATVLRVSDDGVGFDLHAIDEYVAAAHIGLLSQRERIEANGGRLDITSAPGAGTALTARLPRGPIPTDF